MSENTTAEYDVNFLEGVVKFIKSLPDTMEGIGGGDNYVAAKFSIYIDTEVAVTIEWDGEAEQWIADFAPEPTA